MVHRDSTWSRPGGRLGRQRFRAVVAPMDTRTEIVDAGSVAVFDLDRTLLPGSSLVSVARVFVKRGMLPPTMLVSASMRNLLFRLRGFSDEAVEALVAECLGHARGLPVEVVAAAFDDVRELLIPKLRSELVGEVGRQRELGRTPVVLSASPVEVVRMVAEAVGADHGIGTVSEIVDGRYTGRLLGPVCYGPAKLTHLDHHLGEVDWSTSWAWSDAASDVPLLSAVANPVAVNPDRQLRKKARAEAWPILDLAS